MRCILWDTASLGRYDIIQHGCQIVIILDFSKRWNFREKYWVRHAIKNMLMFAGDLKQGNEAL